MTNPVLHTVGHSRHDLPAFLGILRAHGIVRIADVRRFPVSRRLPWFSGKELAAALAAAGIAYRHFPDLGGYRGGDDRSRHVAWRQPGLRAYADHMDSPRFRSALDALLARAGEAPTAALCAEADPSRCHRQLLADAALLRGFRVLHLLDADAVREHRLPAFARVEGDRLVYDGGTIELDLG